MTLANGLIHFSIIDYLNALPLNMAFKDGLFEGQVDLTFDYPSQCADNLASGRCEVGLISSIEYQRIANLRIAPGICIASRHEVRSVLILTRKPLSDVKTVALDRFSRSSVALLRILFHRRFGFQPQFITMTPQAEPMLAEADAALIIGDAALRALPQDVDHIDLAREWNRDTGLPFVFAFWAIRRGANTAAVCDILNRAKAYGMPRIATRMDDIRARWPLPENDILDYFHTNIHYDLGEPELASLALFYRYAEEAGLIKHPSPPRFAT
ncbi:Chorismate dehydratase [Sulfidibacter corallicola]|uniref:Chorismate dehydratase n=1 Tax=Sulfidibacter corallicola TaxID=2818388 RepID=A0A8A4TRC8_SULCO|nr:menaquinone biosynthesis protein [Sulfidibacter corallicola]QTD51541.1 menaquinone biosynthesis protein [Sulfidibacter corallicola]